MTNFNSLAKTFFFNPGNKFSSPYPEWTSNVKCDHLKVLINSLSNISRISFTIALLVVTKSNFSIVGPVETHYHLPHYHCYHLIILSLFPTWLIINPTAVYDSSCMNSGDMTADINIVTSCKLSEKLFYFQLGENIIKLQYLWIFALWCCQFSGFEYVTIEFPKWNRSCHSNLSVPYQVSLNTLALQDFRYNLSY
jgi:hypothetical protein